MDNSPSDRVEAPGQPAPDAVMAPPRTILGILRQLGPGLIIAGSIVGSGELIATTKTGAQAGFWLLWLIIIGCVIKVFVQVEFGRHAISSGETTMSSLNDVPGPRWRVNWILWFWLAMFLVSMAQLGGIVNGIGQSLAMNVPIDGSFNELLLMQDKWDAEAAPVRKSALESSAPGGSQDKEARARIDREVIEQLGRPRPGPQTPGFFWTDDITWATLVALLTVFVLVIGRYGLIQNFSMVMVAAFTGMTVFCVFALQAHEAWAIHWSDLRQGMSFRLPPMVEGMSRWTPLATALATFGIIGVGTSELISYPYWCLEKGYGRFTGRRDQSDQWAARARGWLRVMRWDAGVSMLIYTFATVAFYLLGAAVLSARNNRPMIDPAGSQMVRTLSEMYVPVFGVWAKWLFLFGAVAVLYSTFFVAIAGHTRVVSDAVRVFGIGARTEQTRRTWMRFFCVFFPLFALTTSIFIRKPAEMVLLSGVMQAVMLPMLAGATLYFRYCLCDKRITPGRLWDIALWTSAAGMLLAGGWIAVTKILNLVLG